MLSLECLRELKVALPRVDANADLCDESGAKFLVLGSLLRCFSR